MRSKQISAFFVVAAISSSLLCVAFGAAESRPTVDSARGLDERVAALEAKIAGLERTVTLLQVTAKMKQPLLVVPQPQVGPGAQKMPPGSEARQFNGSTYYLVPLGSSDGAH